MTQIEEVSNSSTLTPLFADVNNHHPLTPGYFLVRDSLFYVSENNLILDYLPFSLRMTVVQKLKISFDVARCKFSVNEKKTVIEKPST